MDRAEWFTLFLSFIAIVIAIHADYNSYYQNKLTEDINHLNIDPEVRSYFYYPDLNHSSSDSSTTKVINDGTFNIVAFKDTNQTFSGSPVIVVKNNGSLSIASLGVGYESVLFDKMNNLTTYGIKGYDSLNDIGGEHMIFEKNVEPKGYVFSFLPNYRVEASHYIPDLFV